MHNLYVVRGLPGSGKSTFVRNMACMLGCEYFEADMFFEDEDTGEYKFDPKLIGNAHKWCQTMVNMVMNTGNDVFVSNTFTTEKELAPYFEMAEKYGYHVTSLVVENRHGNKSVHGVPEETMEKMRNRFSVRL